MEHRQIMGKEGLTLAAIASLAMAAVAFFVDTAPDFIQPAGICLPSPQGWNLPHFAGWLINVLAICAVCLLIGLMNKEYKIVPGGDTVTAGLFALITASNIWISGHLTSSSVFALANIICMLIIFSCFDKRNATKDLFVTGSILSFGSMIQYSFIFLMPFYLIAAVIVKKFNIKVVTAYAMGLVAPYWVVFGLDIISPHDVSFPEVSHIGGKMASASDIFIGMLNIAVTVFWGLIAALIIASRNYMGNSRQRSCYAIINLLGLFLIACMVFDFENIVAYIATAYLIASIQLGNLFAPGNIKSGRLWVLGFAALYIGGFVLMAIF